MNEEIKDLIEQLNVCSVNDYNFEIYGNEAKVLNEYITNLQQKNSRLKDKLNKINDLLNEPIFEYDNIPNGIEEEINELKNILKEN